MQSTAAPSTSGACPVAPSSSFSSFPCHAASVSCRAVAGAGASAAPLRIRRQLPSLPLFSHRRTTAAAVAAAEVPGERQEGADIAGRLRLGAMIVVWYLLNIYFNIYNKQVLKALPFPYTITAFQLASGSLFILLMWATNLHPAPKVSLAQLATILPLAIAHTLGTVFTNMSLGKVAVSFTHTVKAMEPFFTVLLSVVFLGERPSPMVMTSLVPIVGGVALASLTEVSFNWIGFWSAMASNLTNQSRNVLSKNHIGDKEESLDNINLFSIITVMSFVLSTPLMLVAEGIMFTPSYLQSTGTNIRELCVGAALAGFCFHGYQQVSYMILARVSPVTHSVANCVKRVVIIVSSIIFFRTPISPVNALGTGVALGGVFLYSRLKKTKPKLA